LPRLIAFAVGLTWSSTSIAAELELIRGAQAPIVLEQKDLVELGPEGRCDCPACGSRAARSVRQVVRIRIVDPVETEASTAPAH